MTRVFLALLLCLLAAPAWAGPYIGDFPTSATVRCMYTTNGQDGASITRSTDGTLKVYKAGSVTERSSLNGITQTEDFDSATGVHLVAIDTTDNTDAGFWAAAGEYDVVNTGMTIDTKTVNGHVCSFSIQRSGGALALILARLPNATPGAAGGVAIAGANAATTYATLTVTGATTLTGNVALADGLTIAAPSTGNRAGVTITGNGTGAGIIATGGATGHGLAVVGGGTSGNGLDASATTSGIGISAVGTGTTKAGIVATGGSTSSAGMLVTGGGSGNGLSVAAGSTGKGVAITTTAGDGLSILPTAGHAIVATANGTSKNGLFVTGGTAGTSNGAKFVAGFGGVDLLAATGITVDACTGCSASGGTTIMPEAAYVKGATSVIHEIFIKDSSTNLGKTGLTFASANLVVAFGRADQGNAAYSACTAATATLGSYTSCGFKEKDATNAPGWYELGLTTAMLATGADYVTVSVYGVSGTTPTQLPIALVDIGLAAINTKLGTPAGASMSADTAAVQTTATAIKAKTDQISFSGSNVLANTQATASSLTFDRIGTLTGAITGNITGNLSGSVGSVTGAVGSVTGTVGGNVTGSVGSVVGAVGSVTGNVGGNVTGSAGSVVGAVGSVTGNVGGNVVGSVASVTAETKSGDSIRKNVASQTYPVYLVLAADHITAATGKSPAAQVSKDGAAFGNIAGSIAEIGSGWYLISLAQADTNCDVCAYRVTEAASDTRNFYALTGP